MKISARDAPSGLFHGWRLVGSGFVLQGLVTAAVSYSYGVVLAPIAGELGASRFEMMWGITASTLVSGAVSLGRKRDVARRAGLRDLHGAGGVMLLVAVPAACLVPLARDHGHPAELAAMLMSAIAGCGMVGKLALGIVADRIDLRMGLAAAILPVLACLLLLMADSRYITMFAASSLLGFAAGGMLPIWGSLMAVLFGATCYGRVMGLMSPVMMPAVLAGSPFAGWSYDQSGSYLPALAAFAAVLLLTLVALSRIRMPG